RRSGSRLRLRRRDRQRIERQRQRHPIAPRFPLRRGYGARHDSEGAGGCEVVSLMLLRALAASGVAASLLAACSLAPPYKPPATAQVANYKEAGDWLPAQPADAQQRGTWWEVFGDPQLNELEHQLDKANPDLQAAVARFEQARAIAREEVSNEFPTLGLGASGERARSSGNAPLGG